MSTKSSTRKSTRSSGTDRVVKKMETASKPAKAAPAGSLRAGKKKPKK
jgi:hypothetical protein